MSCLSQVNMFFTFDISRENISFTFDLGQENIFRSFEKQFAQCKNISASQPSTSVSLACTPKKRISLKENMKTNLPEFRHLLEPSYEPSRKSCLLGPERREDGAETRTGCNGW